MKRSVKLEYAKSFIVGLLVRKQSSQLRRALCMFFLSVFCLYLLHWVIFCLLYPCGCQYAEI